MIKIHSHVVNGPFLILQAYISTICKVHIKNLHLAPWVQSLSIKYHQVDLLDDPRRQKLNAKNTSAFSKNT
jgi:hypothetical protein